MRRILTALFLAGLLVVPAGAAQADDTYAPSIPTSCHVSAPQITAVGRRVVLTIEISSNSTTPEVGSVKLTISTRAARQARARAVVWTKTVRYAGTPLEVRGPKLPRGRYTVAMAFTPDGGELVGCTNTGAFRVGGGGDVGGETDGGSGGLPNTGGPHLWILLAGLSLIVGGGGLVGGSRRPVRVPAGAHRTARI